MRHDANRSKTEQTVPVSSGYPPCPEKQNSVALALSFSLRNPHYLHLLRLQEKRGCVQSLCSVFMFSLFNQLKLVFSCSICVSEFRGTELTELILK